jgi:multiple sugar transport system substrate-binding protein
MSRRTFVTRSAAAALALPLLAACGGGAPAAPAASPAAQATTAPVVAKPTTAPAAAPTTAANAAAAPTQPAKTGKVELRFMRFAGVGWEQDVKFVDEFMQKNPDIVVKGEDTPYGQMNQKVLTLGASDTIADLFSTHTRWVSFWESKGICHELDALAKTFSTETKFDDFFPSVIKDARGPGADGKLYLFPTIVHPGGNAIVLLNLDLIKKAGLTPPTSSDWTVQQLEDLVRGAAKPKDGIFGLEVSYSSPLYSTQVTRSWSSVQGPPASPDSWVLSPDGKKSQLGSPPVKESFEWYHKLIMDGFVPTSEAAPAGPGLDQFTAGKMVAQAAEIGRVQADHDIIKDKFTYTAFLWPKGKSGSRGSCLSYNGHCISAKTKNPEEAFHLLNAITSTEAGFWAGYEGHANPFARHSIWFDERLWKRYPIDEDGAHWLEQGIDPFPMPWNLRAQEYQDAFIQHTQKYLDGKENWDQMYPATQKAAQDIIDQPRP